MFKKILLSTLYIFTSALAFSQSDTCTGAPTIAIVADCTTPTVNYSIPTGNNDSLADPSCINSRRDGWYVFTTSAATTEISITSTTDRSLGLSIYTGTCAGTLTEFACSNGLNLLNVTVTASTTYYLRLSRNSNGNNDTNGTICIEDVTPTPTVPNDECAGAIGLTVNADLSCGVVTSGTTVGATASSQPDDVDGTPNNDVWFSFTATATSHVISILNVVNQGGGSTSTDMGIGLYDASSGCGGLILNSTSDPETYTATGLTIGNSYLVRVYGWFSSIQNNNFDICIGTDPPCTTPDPPSALIFGTITTSAINGSFTQPTPNADNYLVLMNTTGAAPANPVNGISYPVGDNSLGATVIDDDGNANFTATGLTDSTTYYFFIFAFNNTDCIGGPNYSATSLNDNATTMAPLSNDDCVDAIALTVNSSCSFTTYTNDIATDSGVADPLCSDYQGGDVWFSAIVPASGSLIVDTDTGVITDSGMAIYSGTCGSLTLIECDDDDSGNGAMSYISLTGQTPGATLYIRVFEFGNNNNGTFSICAFEPIPPANDDCANATALTVNSDLNCGNVTAGTTDGATASSQADDVFGTPNNDVWFSFTAISTSHEISLSNIVNNGGGTSTSLDMGIGLYDASGGCGSLVLNSSSDPNSYTATGLTIGNSYVVRVYGYSTSVQNNNFDICIGTAIPPGTNGVNIGCPGDPSQSLTTDLVCANGGGVDFLGFGGAIDTSYTNTLVSGDPIALQPEILIEDADGCTFEPSNTANYKTVDFTVNANATYTFTSSSSFDTMGYIVIDDGSWTAGSCPGTWTWITGDDDSGPVLQSELTANLSTGITYTFVTTAYSSGNIVINNQSFTWTVTTTSSDPEWYDAATGGTMVGTGAAFDPVAAGALADTNTPGVYTFWADDCNGTREAADFTIGKVWDVTTGDTDWSNPSNWIPNGVPSISDCVVIPAGTPNDPIIQGGDDATSYSLTLFTGATVTLDDSTADANYATLTIQDYLSLQGTSTLQVQNNSSLIQINESGPNVNNNLGTGTLILDREANIRNTDYVYWSSPVSNLSLSNVYGANTPNYTYQWIPTVPTGTTPPPDNIPICFGDWSSYSGNMEIGKGYISRAPNGHPAGPAVATATFTGTANNGVITQAIISGDNSISNSNFTYNPYGNDLLTVTPFDDNWNLIGNPYPSAISANAFINYSGNTIIEGAVHIWTHGSLIGAYADSFYDDYALNYNPNDYITYNLTGTNTYSNEVGGSDYLIGSGQGFFVLALNDNESGSVTFSNSMRSNGYTNTNFFRSAITTENNDIEKHRVWLNLISDNEEVSNTLVGYITGATNEKDRAFDAYTFENDAMSLYSLIDDERMVIQGRQLPFQMTDQIPLGIDIKESGNYLIVISGVDGLFEGENGQDIYLEDTTTGIIHDLRNSPYSFNIEEGTYSDRFLLRYTNETLSVNAFEDTSSLTIYIEDELVQLTSETQTIKSVNVYNVLGQTLIETGTINSFHYALRDLSPSNGVLFVKAILNDGRQKIQKILY